jgi:hypothetical protein
MVQTLANRAGEEQAKGIKKLAVFFQEHGDTKQGNYFLIFFILALFVTLYRIYQLTQFPFDLYPDEAQYWFWAQNPAWGYFSKPPMIAWVLMASTSLCGDTELCIRIGSPISYLLVSILIYLIGCELTERRVAFFSSIIFLTMPGVSISSQFASTDPFLLLFWSLATYVFLRAIKTNLRVLWLGLGISAGLGLLTKYNFVLFFPSVFLFLIYSKTYRRHLRNPRLYLAVVLSFVIYLPNLSWNLQNGLITYSQTASYLRLDHPEAHWGGTAELLGAQFAMFGPIMFAVLLRILCSPKTYRVEADHNFLLFFVLPLLSVVLAISLLSKAHGNWTAPIYFAGSILAVRYLLPNRRVLIWVSILINIMAVGIFHNFHYLANLTGIELTRKRDPFHQMDGWRELGERVSSFSQQYPGSWFLTMDRRTSTELLYYVKPRAGKLVRWNPKGLTRDHFDLTSSLKEGMGDSFLLVAKGKIRWDVEMSFLEVKKLAVVGVPLTKDYTREHSVYYLRGFKGYPKD